MERNTQVPGRDVSTSYHNGKIKTHPEIHNVKRQRVEKDGTKKGTEPRPSRRLSEVRLILDSSPSDDQFTEQVMEVQDEIRAVDNALDDEGTYLGIVDKEELKKRKQQLERRVSLIVQERELLQTLRAQVEGVPGNGGFRSFFGPSQVASRETQGRDKGRKSVQEEEQATAERAESRVHSSSPSRNDSGSKNENIATAATTTAAAAAAAAAAGQSSSSARAAAKAGTSSISPGKHTYRLTPPPAAGKGGGGSIEDFIKKSSAALGKNRTKGAGGIPPSSLSPATSSGSRMVPAQVLELETPASRGAGSRNIHKDSEVVDLSQ